MKENKLNFGVDTSETIVRKFLSLILHTFLVSYNCKHVSFFAKSLIISLHLNLIYTSRHIYMNLYIYRQKLCELYSIHCTDVHRSDTDWYNGKCTLPQCQPGVQIIKLTDKSRFRQTQTLGIFYSTRKFIYNEHEYVQKIIR